MTIEDPVVETNRGAMKASALPPLAQLLPKLEATELELAAAERLANPPALTLLRQARDRKTRAEEALAGLKKVESEKKTAWDAVEAAANEAQGLAGAVEKKIHEAEFTIGSLWAKQRLPDAVSQQADCKCPTCGGKLDLEDAPRLQQIAADAKKGEAELRAALDALRLEHAAAAAVVSGFDDRWEALDKAVRSRTDAEDAVREIVKEISGLEGSIDPEEIRQAEVNLDVVARRCARGRAIVAARRRYEESAVAP